MKKTIELSVIADAIEAATDDWWQYYNTTTGEIKSLPDPSNGYVDRLEFEKDAEEIEESGDYIPLPTQWDRNDYSIMEAFAEEKNSGELFRTLRGHRPFRSFKDRAIEIGLIQDYYAFHSRACARLAREWCEDNEVPYIEDEKLRKAITPTGSNGHDYVDLGHSVKWATMNLGAAKISDPGGYYAWGETGKKDDYTWGAYQHGSSADALTKYNFADGGLSLEAADDAAAANWGGAWRIPTSAEWEELCDKRNCKWEWTKIENTPGYKITGKKAGFTDKSIFLPAAGYFRGCSIEGAESSGYYWSATRNRPFEDRAICLFFIPTFIGIGNNGFRNGGFTIRPVMK